MTDQTPTRDEAVIAGRTLEEWRIHARRDDCLERMVPSDLRQLIGAIPASAPAPASGVDAVAWPEPKVRNPDIPAPTGVPYIDSLIDQLLDAQQDINLAANERMDQSLCDASTLIEEVERALRIAASLSPAATPVSEAEPVGRGDLIDGLDDLARRMPASADKLLLSEAIGLIQSLAKPASSPAGGDVVREAAARVQLRAITALPDDAWAALNRLRFDDLGRLFESLAEAALSQSTSAGRVGE